MLSRYDKYKRYHLNDHEFYVITYKLYSESNIIALINNIYNNGNWILSRNHMGHIIWELPIGKLIISGY